MIPDRTRMTPGEIAAFDRALALMRARTAAAAQVQPTGADDRRRLQALLVEREAQRPPLPPIAYPNGTREPIRSYRSDWLSDG